MDGGAGHCPDARGVAVQAACGLLGSEEDADGRAHLPLSGTVAAGLPGSVECRRCVSTGSRNTNKEALLVRMTVAVWRVMGVADGEERPQAAERRTALSSHRWAE